MNGMRGRLARIAMRVATLRRKLRKIIVRLRVRERTRELGGVVARSLWGSKVDVERQGQGC